MALRTRRGAVLVKTETIEGVYDQPADSDGILVENPRISFDPSLVQTNELTPSLDPRASIVGGLKVSFGFDIYLKGSGTPETPPKFGKLFTYCGWEEVIRNAAIPAGAPEALAAGSATTATLAASATGTAQLYRGMPLLIARPSSLADYITFITNYTAGKVATLANSFTPALDVDEEYQILKHVLYRPTSDESLIKSASFAVHMDGVRYKFAGCRGDMNLTLQAGQPGKLACEFTGMYIGKDDDAVPAVADLSLDATVAPIWRDPNDDASGHFSIERLEAALRQLQFNNGNTRPYPDNPNSSEGFDATIITQRRMTFTMDPLATLVATRDIMADFRTGQTRIVHARLGTVAGNRFGLLIPQGAYERYAPGDREGLATEEVTGFCQGEDAGAFMAFF